MEAAVAKAEVAARTEVQNSSSDARWQSIKELVVAADSLATTAQLWASRVVVLARAGLGSDERANFMRQLEGAGPVELTNMAVHAAATGKVSGIEYQSGENGAPDLIMADVALADGTEKTVAINPADGKVMNITLAENDQQGGAQDGENANN